jgi:Ca-activated chloride channel family protein
MESRKFSSRLVPAFAVVVTLALVAPAPAAAQNAPIKSGVDMVSLTVTVTDTAGKYVSGLTNGDFKVFEDGVEQSLSFFATDAVPLDLALVLDTSGSMKQDLPLVQNAALGLVHKLREGDRGAVVEVKDRAAFPQSLTADLSLVEAAVRGLTTSGSTALYDTLYIVLKEFDRERKATADVRRQALVLLTDGLDNKSRLSFEDVMDLARRVGVSIYVIALRGDVALIPRAELDGSILSAEYTMGSVARESGGRTFFPKSARELPTIYGAIAQELCNQYELGYMPVRPAGDGSFRRVTVNVSPQTNALARTRTGYYASRSRTGM